MVAGDFGSDSPDSGAGAPPLAQDHSAIQVARPVPVTPSARSVWPDAAHCRQEHRDLEPYSPLYVGSMVISRVLSDRPPTAPGVDRATSPAPEGDRVLSAAPPGLTVPAVQGPQPPRVDSATSLEPARCDAATDPRAQRPATERQCADAAAAVWQGPLPALPHLQAVPPPLLPMAPPAASRMVRPQPTGGAGAETSTAADQPPQGMARPAWRRDNASGRRLRRRWVGQWPRHRRSGPRRAQSQPRVRGTLGPVGRHQVSPLVQPARSRPCWSSGHRPASSSITRILPSSLRSGQRRPSSAVRWSGNHHGSRRADRLGVGRDQYPQCCPSVGSGTSHEGRATHPFLRIAPVATRQGGPRLSVIG